MNMPTLNFFAQELEKDLQRMQSILSKRENEYRATSKENTQLVFEINKIKQDVRKKNERVNQLESLNQNLMQRMASLMQIRIRKRI
jgi:uncharacterized protein YoxC